MLSSFIKRILELPRPQKMLYLLYGIAGLLVLARISFFAINQPYYEGDTKILVEGVKAIRICLSESHFSGCTFDGPFPLLQYVPSLLLSYLGFTSSTILHLLAILSLLSFIGSLLLIFWTLNRTRSLPLALIALVVMLTGPLLWYAHSTYSEMAAGFLILAFTAANLLRAPGWMIILLFVLAGATKEIAFPFLFVIGLLCLMPEIITYRKKEMKRVVTLIVGAALTVSLSMAFNYFRYSTLYNQDYFSTLTIVPTLRLQLIFFLGIWFSPNAGLSFFWPVFVILFFSVLGMILFQVIRPRRDHQNRTEKVIFYLPIIVITSLLLLLTLGFARWFTPYGGAAWGPRLILPWIPGTLLLLLYFYSTQVLALLSLIWQKPLIFAFTCALVLIVSIPQFTLLFDSRVLGDIFAPTVDCPRRPVIQEDIIYYYRCMEFFTWPRRITLLDSFLTALKPSVLWFSILYSITIVGVCHLIRNRLKAMNISPHRRKRAPDGKS